MGPGPIADKPREREMGCQIRTAVRFHERLHLQHLDNAWGGAKNHVHLARPDPIMNCQCLDSVVFIYLQELEEHGVRVLKTLGNVVSRLTDLETLMPELQNLAARHIKYGVEMPHYDYLASACLVTMEQALGKKWSQEHKDAWFSAFGVIGAAAQQVNTPGGNIDAKPAAS